MPTPLPTSLLSLTHPLTTTLTHCLTNSTLQSPPNRRNPHSRNRYFRRLLHNLVHLHLHPHHHPRTLSPHHASVAASNIAHAGYTSNVTIIVGDTSTSLSALKASGAVFDLIFIDADWSSQGAYFNAGVDLLRPRGCIYVDNIVRELFEEVEEGKAIVKESMLAMVGRDERVMATMVTTASSHKGNEREALDGVLLAVKK